MGTFAVSTDALDSFSVTGIAFSILSGISNGSQAISSITKALPKLENKIGYNDRLGIDPATHLSPNTNGFLLEAVMQTAAKVAQKDAGQATRLVKPAKFMLEGLWAAMVTQDEYYSGASWEYVYNDGRPGLDLFTSLSHPWGSAPSYVLPEYVLGLRAAKPGWSEWTLQPFWYGCDLGWVSGQVQTPHGRLSASWKVVKRDIEVVVTAPKDTKGSVWVSGKTIKVEGGRTTTIKESL